MTKEKICFSNAGYRGLLEKILESGYSIAPLRESFLNNDLTVILRHDVDFSVDFALEMALIEKELGVRSTFFFMITCDYYNVLSEENRNALNKIASLGHEIGLHWDSRFMPNKRDEQVEFFNSQLRILSSVIGESIQSVSQHIPTDTPNFDIDPLVNFNAYSKRINDKYRYVSDSSMVWREHTPLDFIADRASFQFLAHPIWWIAEGVNQTEKIRNFVRSLDGHATCHAEKYIIYMNEVLENRSKFDENFRISRELK